ncbi:MAG: hypothetical protein ACKVSF_10620 [Alphaproteobacteria bacterium]
MSILHTHDDSLRAPTLAVRRAPRARAVALRPPAISDEAFTIALYASIGGAGILFLVGTLAYGYATVLSLI